MKTIPGTWLFLLDKIMAILCFFFYWSDICEMYITSTMYVRDASRSKEKEKEKEDKKAREEKALEKAKEEIENKTKKDDLNESLTPLETAKPSPRMKISKTILKDLPQRVPEHKLTPY